MAKRADLRKLSLLIVDSDAQLAQVCAQTLRAMGFGRVAQVRDSQAALAFLDKSPVDIVITERSMLGEASGLDLVCNIRGFQDLAKRVLSIIMLSAQSELEDVKAARDAGINEFMVKPFTAKTLFARLEQIIENPRSFVFARDFTGPDRRRRRIQAVEENKRKTEPRLTRSMAIVPAESAALPQALPPDHGLREKIGLEGKLSAVITPAVLEQAQATIESFKDQSHAWIESDIQALMAAQKRLAARHESSLLREMEARALSVKARAGMYGHGIVSDVAQMLHRFLCSDYRERSQPHNLILKKYVEALYAAFTSDMTSRDIRLGQALIQDLKRLGQKFAETPR